MTDKLDLLLIYPSDSYKNYDISIPLCLCYLASVVEQDGFKVKIVDLNVEKVDLKKIIGLYKPSVVGISGITQTRFESFRIADTVKSIDRSISVVYGGCHASTATEDTLRNIASIDIIIRGYGEWIMKELMRGINNKGFSNLHKISGISYRQNGTIYHNPMPQNNRELDELPYRIRHFVDNKKYLNRSRFTKHMSTAIISSRGCTMNCVFCSATLISNHTYATRSPKNICDEIEWLKQTYGVNQFFFSDDDISLNKKHINYLCDEILARRLNILWECRIRVDSVDYNLLKKMYSAGCRIIHPGIESATSRILKLINKHIEIKQVEEVFNWAYKIGFFTLPFFMLGLPTQTFKEALQTLDFIDRHRREISYPTISYGTRIYPGTKLEEFALENGFLSKDFSWSRPYYCKENISLAENPYSPLLIQPQLGFPELKKLLHSFIMRSFLKPKPRFIRTTLSRICAEDQLKKYFGVIRNW